MIAKDIVHSQVMTKNKNISPLLLSAFLPFCTKVIIIIVTIPFCESCVFLFFFLVLLNDPSKSFHHPCFYYNLWKGNGLPWYMNISFSSSKFVNSWKALYFFVELHGVVDDCFHLTMTKMTTMMIMMIILLIMMNMMILMIMICNSDGGDYGWVIWSKIYF